MSCFNSSLGAFELNVNHNENMLKEGKARLVLKEGGVEFFLKDEILKRWAVFL